MKARVPDAFLELQVEVIAQRSGL